MGEQKRGKVIKAQRKTMTEKKLVKLLKHRAKSEEMIAEKSTVFSNIEESEERCRTIFENTGTATMILEEDMTLSAVNTEFTKFFGYSKEDVENKMRLSDLVFNDDINKVKEFNTARRVNTNNVPRNYEIRAVNSQGDVRNVLLTVDLIRGTRKSVVSLLDITERKQAENVLREQREWFQVTLSSIGDAVIATDINGNTIFMNNVAEELTGYTKTESLGRPIADVFNIIHEETRGPAEIPIHKVIRDELVVGLANHSTIISKNGTERSILNSAAPIKNNNGESIGVVIVFKDITERKKAELELKLNEARYRELFENIDSGVAVFEAVEGGRDFIFQDFNRSAERIEGIKKEKLIGKSVLKAFPDLKQSGLFDVFQRVWETGEPEHFPAFMHNNGDTIIWRKNYVYKLPSGEIVAVYDDITDKKQAEEILQRYHLIFENARDIIMIIRSDGRIIEANQAALSTYGYQREELLSMTIHELSRSRINCVDGDGILFETIHYRKDGSAFPVEVSSQGITFNNENDLLYIVRNTTKRRQIENLMKESLENVQRILEGTVNALAATAENRDPYTAGHQRRVARLASLIAKTMGLPDERVEGVRVAALLHDIGKIFVPTDILNKPCRLTDIEMSLMREHARIGYDIIKTIPFSSPIAQFILQHHERVNGLGYPLGLSGDEILLEAKIIGVADVVEAMSSHRPYRPALGMKMALIEITRNKGILYDPDVVEACLQTVRMEGQL